MVLDLKKIFKSRSVKSPPEQSSSRIIRNSYPSLDNPVNNIPSQRSFVYDGDNKGDFYRYLRDNIPIISAGIWTWVHLCTTPQRVNYRGDEREIKRAHLLIEDLQRRIFPRRDGDNHGFERLTESFFLDLFTMGRTAIQVHLFKDGSGISHVEALDPYRIKWVQNRDGSQEPKLLTDNDNYRSINKDLFFHRTLTTDFHQPDGIEPLASLPFVVEIEQRMLEDMARSSHNAGTQRLQIRLSPPERIPGEDYETYTTRISSYFDKTISQFRELGPDDNIFTWSDVQVELVGGSGKEGSVWKLNREQVLEDVITGLKLFPWALGRSHGTTKNWIFAQYNLLMQIVDSVQRLGSDLIEWLMHLELRLDGNLTETRWNYAPNQDPFIVERNNAKLLELERIERLVDGGFISHEQGVRELGYELPDVKKKRKE